MEILTLKLFSKNIIHQEAFYQHLGFTTKRLHSTSLNLQAGKTVLHFAKAEKKFQYHFAFLIPTGKIEEAIFHYFSTSSLSKLISVSLGKLSGTGCVTSPVAAHSTPLKKEVLNPIQCIDSFKCPIGI
jgi:hypothetical protein